MHTPLQITAHDLTLADTVEAEIREKAAKLERYYHSIISCHVVVGAPVGSAHASHSQAGLYHVSIDLTVPGAELVMTRHEGENEKLIGNQIWHFFSLKKTPTLLGCRTSTFSLAPYPA